MEEAIKRGCRHSEIYTYAEMYAVCDIETEDSIDDIKAFQTKEAKEGAKEFARKIFQCASLER